MRPSLVAVGRASIERKLRRLAERSAKLREEAAVLAEQSAHFSEMAEEARMRALVSETPVAEQEHRDAQRHADAMAGRLAEVRAELAQLESDQDALLDRLAEGS